MRQMRQHLTYANVMATIAVFLVLSGGTAVALSGTDTVQSDDLGPGAQVMAADVAANAVNGPDVVNNSLTGADINEATLGFTTVAKAAGNVTDADPNGNGPDTPVVGAGPSVTVNVPADGIVNVLARATLNRSGTGGGCVVALAETATNQTALVSQQLLYSDSTSPQTLISMPSRRTELGDSFARAGWISFPATAGAHTYRLVYWASGAPNAVTCTFSNRTLWASVTG
jgi:hypothetical protein